MNNTVHATFAHKDNGIRAVEELLAYGFSGEDISLILPDEHAEKHKGASIEPHTVVFNSEAQPTIVHPAHTAHPEVPNPPELPQLPSLTKPHYYDEDRIMAPGASGYGYDALGAVIPDSATGTRRRTSKRRIAGETLIDGEEGLSVGIGLGLVTALCLPGIGMFAGSGALIAYLMASVGAAGGLAGSVYGYMKDHGSSHDTASAVSDHIISGGTSLSITTSGTDREKEIVRIIKHLNGQMIGTTSEA